jgi:hypothetical protein
MKTEVYSWRISPQIKRTLEQEARKAGTSVAVLLERITKEWLLARNDRENDEERQTHLRASVNRTIGVISGKNPNRSKQTRATVRKRIALRHGQ